jgi:CO/xanthine dehydrogenase Mo-binding subunit
MAFKYIGKDFPRPDGVQKAQGSSVYIDDIRLPDMLFAQILRPDFAHVEIISIDTSEAEGDATFHNGTIWGLEQRFIRIKRQIFKGFWLGFA